MAKMGRPTKYNEELADKICEAIATSFDSVVDICKRHDDFPDDTQIYKWLWKYEYFYRKYAKARAFQAEMMAKEIQKMCVTDAYIDEKGVERLDPGKVSQTRLKVDTLKWQASKLVPKIYGDQRLIEDLTAENAHIKAELEQLRAKLYAQNKKEY